VSGAWSPLASTGVANHIYATNDVVLRVATDHTDGIPDARTESVAAPAAHAAGILTPRMIAFDDTRTIVDRPFSLWERVHGATLGAITLSDDARSAAWRAVGRELARLHRLVTLCPDPDGYLDVPGDYPDIEWFRRGIACTAHSRKGDQRARRRGSPTVCSDLGACALTEGCRFQSRQSDPRRARRANSDSRVRWRTGDS
jgi:hypothetical protein